MTGILTIYIARWLCKYWIM